MTIANHALDLNTVLQCESLTGFNHCAIDAQSLSGSFILLFFLDRYYWRSLKVVHQSCVTH